MSIDLTINPFKQDCDFDELAALRHSVVSGPSNDHFLKFDLGKVEKIEDAQDRYWLTFGDSAGRYTLRAQASVEQDKPPLKSKITWHEVDGLGLGRITVPKGV